MIKPTFSEYCVVSMSKFNTSPEMKYVEIVLVDFLQLLQYNLRNGGVGKSGTDSPSHGTHKSRIHPQILSGAWYKLELSTKFSQYLGLLALSHVRI